MKKLVLLLATLLCVAACTSTPVAPEHSGGGDSVPYVGLTVVEAEKKAAAVGVPFRVVMENGTSLPVTMDYVVGRINAEVVNGIVQRITVEGSEQDPPAADAPMGPYDQHSWKTMVPAACTVFFDGCNNCRRIDGGSDAGCTKKYCETYQKPACLDGTEGVSAGADLEGQTAGSALVEAEAKAIAEASCVKGGETLSEGSYNPSTQTWWFDANLNSAREGCNPACVVSEVTKTAELNWRCTGLVPPGGSNE